MPDPTPARKAAEHAESTGRAESAESAAGAPSEGPAAPTTGALPAVLDAVVGDVEWVPVGAGRSTSAVHRATRADGTTVFLKTAAAVGAGDGAALLAAEHERLRWFAGRLPVPEVLGWSVDDRTGSAFLLTAALAGTPATSDEHRGDAEVLIRALAKGLRAVHDLPVDDCPFDARLDVRIGLARARVRAGFVDESDFEPAYQRYTAARLFELLEASRPTTDEELVVVHGDFSFDNVFLDAGAVVGYLDVGLAGVADRYVDLAVAASNVAHHISPHALGPFFDLYGIDLPDVVKVDFYVLLDEFF